MGKKIALGIILILIVCAGIYFRAGIASVVAGLLVIAGFSDKRKSDNPSIPAADRQAADAERANREAVGSMDSVSRDGEGIRESGRNLVETGSRLVESSQSLIDELRKQDEGANTNQG